MTGSTGFVGRSVVSVLQQRGNELVCSLRKQSSSVNAVGPEMVFCHGELTPDFDWTTALKGIDVVVHLAGMAHVRHGFGIKEIVLFGNFNVLGTQNVAQ